MGAFRRFIGFARETLKNIPDNHGVVVIRGRSRCWLWGEICSITKMSEDGGDVVLNRYCAGAATMNEKEGVYLLYKRENRLFLKKFKGKELLQRRKYMPKCALC